MRLRARPETRLRGRVVILGFGRPGIRSVFVTPLRDRIGREQREAWNVIQRAAFDLVRDGDPGDPWLFHGTCAISAGWILRDGFRPMHLHGAAGRGFPCGEGVYWGHPAVAASFAERWADSDNLPLLFAARSSAVAFSTPDGRIRPDYFACTDAGCPRAYPDGMDFGDPGIPGYDLGPAASLHGLAPAGEGGLAVGNWRQSLALSGAVTAPGGRHVPEFAMLAVSPELPCHPDAGRSRAMRLAERPEEWRRAYGDFVPPGMERSVDPRSADGARAVLGLADIAPAPSGYRL